MKKIIYLLLFLAIGKTATAQTISVADVEVLPGETVFYTLTVNVGDGEYLDFGYDIIFPRAGFTTPSTNNNTVNPLWTGGTIHVGEIKYREDEGGIYRGSVGGLNMSPKPTPTIPTGDFEIGSVAFTVAADVPVGEYEVTITNFEFNTATALTRANDVTFTVKVVDLVTLDENSTEAPEAADGVNVLVKRTIAANEWGTICLPFAMSNEQVTAAFGSDVQLCDFTGHDYEEASNGDITSITMNFEPVSPAVIEANHPYLIKVSSPVTEFEVNNVDIVPEDEPCVEYDNGKTGRNRKVLSGFYGTYQANTTVEEFCLFLSGGNFYYSKGLTKMKAFRGYFWTQEILTKVENGSAGAKIGLVINDGETTSLNEELRMKSEEFGEGWYSIDGMKLNGEPKKKGIYIKDGRKVVVK